MESFIDIGGIGAITTTGTSTLGLEVIPAIIGVAEIFIGHRQVIIVEGVTMAEEVIMLEGATLAEEAINHR